MHSHIQKIERSIERLRKLENLFREFLPEGPCLETANMYIEQTRKELRAAIEGIADDWQRIADSEIQLINLLMHIQHTRMLDSQTRQAIDKIVKRAQGIPEEVPICFYQFGD